MQLSLDTILNLIVALLLVGTMIFAYILNARLKKLRSSKDEVDGAILRFDQSVTRAEETIVFLRDVSSKSYVALQDTVQKAQALRDELSFMLERGEILAQSLEHKITENRRDPTPQVAPATNTNLNQELTEESRLMNLLKSRETANKTDPPKNMTKAEESLMDMLRTAR